jgi:hypothetical protein
MEMELKCTLVFQGKKRNSTMRGGKRNVVSTEVTEGKGGFRGRTKGKGREANVLLHTDLGTQQNLGLQKNGQKKTVTK